MIYKTVNNKNGKKIKTQLIHKHENKNSHDFSLESNGKGQVGLFPEWEVLNTLGK